MFRIYTGSQNKRCVVELADVYNILYVFYRYILYGERCFKKIDLVKKKKNTRRLPLLDENYASQMIVQGEEPENLMGSDQLSSSIGIV